MGKNVEVFVFGDMGIKVYKVSKQTFLYDFGENVLGKTFGLMSGEVRELRDNEINKTLKYLTKVLKIMRIYTKRLLGFGRKILRNRGR